LSGFSPNLTFAVLNFPLHPIIGFVKRANLPLPFSPKISYVCWSIKLNRSRSRFWYMIFLKR
jgi:hypothetical protein